MKARDYLESMLGLDVGYDKWYKDNFLKRTPPKRKVRVFLDRNLPAEFKQAIRDYKKFKVVNITDEGDDDQIFSCSSKYKSMLITRDRDFWDDHRFPLHQSPGLIIISGQSDDTIKDLVNILADFLFTFDFIGVLQRFPTFATKMKFQISRSGFINKFLAFDGQVLTLDHVYT